jgi:hypothetical protein
MKQLVVSFTMLLLLSTAGQCRADIMCVTESSRSFMGSTDRNRTECHVSGRRAYVRDNRGTSIQRYDLGLSWRLYETKAEYAERALKPAAESSDIHTLGFEYHPSYEWEIQDTGLEKEVNGFPCRLLTADGDADFARVTWKVWLSRKGDREAIREYRAFLVEQWSGVPEKEALLLILSRHSDSFPAAWDMTAELPIPSTIHEEQAVTALEKKPASPGLFEIPGHYRRR